MKITGSHARGLMLLQFTSHLMRLQHPSHCKTFQPTKPEGLCLTAALNFKQNQCGAKIAI